jgi:predicted nucleic acid-binding protein
MPLPFLDTNVLLRHFLQDHPEVGPKAFALIERIERDELVVRTSDIVVFETVFVLERGYKVAKTTIASGLLRILELPGIILPGKSQYRRVFDLYLASGIGFADCYHAVLMQRLGLNEVISFDRDFDKLPGIIRREE